MRKFVWALTCLFCVVLSSWSQDIKLPVFFLSYNGGVGTEEIEEDLVDPTSTRHTVKFRIKEELSRDFEANLATAVSRKNYFYQAGSYSYWLLNPYIKWNLTDQVRWDTSFRSKWKFFDELDTAGQSKDVRSLYLKTELNWKLTDNLTHIPLLQGIWDLYVNEEKTQQSVVYGLSLKSKLNGFSISGKYRGRAEFPLGTLSQVGLQVNHEFGVNVSYDMNKS